MTVLFASDVHVSARRPERAVAFERFLRGPCTSASTVYLLGDVFDEWLGDDDRRDPHSRIVEAFTSLTGRGVAVRFLHGNHDFLIGERFRTETGCELLPETTRIDLYGTPVVLMHGDTLCTRDEEYQAWRRTFTDPRNQANFLALPFDQRIEQAAALRNQSTTATRLKPDDIMDVTPAAVIEVLRAHDARHMIHGHTHRPDLHRFDLDGATALRAVLGDWYAEERILAWDADGPRLGTIDEIC